MLENLPEWLLFTLDKCARPIVVYGFLLVGLRLAGKRELAQLNAMDLIVLLMLANTVQNAIIGPDNSVIGGLIGASTLLLLNHVVVRYLFSHPKIDQLIEGRPVKLVEDGKPRRADMQRELITRHELEAAAHKQGFRSLGEVQTATLEPSGVISFVGKEPPQGEVWHSDLAQRLDDVARQLAEIRALVAKGSG
ncbi:MAG: DUF421 domain-containing protein [Pirellulales bacterium]